MAEERIAALSDQLAATQQQLQQALQQINTLTQRIGANEQTVRGQRDRDADQGQEMAKRLGRDIIPSGFDGKQRNEFKDFI